MCTVIVHIMTDECRYTTMGAAISKILHKPQSCSFYSYLGRLRDLTVDFEVPQTGNDLFAAFSGSGTEHGSL